jgi:hypothetical protein
MRFYFESGFIFSIYNSSRRNAREIASIRAEAGLGWLMRDGKPDKVLLDRNRKY